MKRITALLLTLLLALSLCGCVEEYNAIQSSGTQNGSSSSSSSADDGSGDEVETEGFTVKLVVEDGGELPALDGISAVWTGRSQVYTAPFDERGVASSEKPDGEYKVTLSATPAGYTYDPNIYEASNKSKTVEILLYKIKEMSGSGSMTDSACYKLPSAGTYRFQFARAEQQLGFVFVPTQSGTYRFSTLMDVTANEVTATFYKHAVQFINPQEITKTNGAATNTYTKNFIVNVEIPEDELGQAHYFSIKIHSLSSNIYPVSIDMRLERPGDYSRPDGWTVAEVPTDIPQATTVAGKTFRFIASLNRNVLDQRLVGSYTAEGKFQPLIGSDGFYRINDGVDDGDIDNNPVLYAKLKDSIPGILENGMNDPLVRHKLGNVMVDYTAFYRAHLAKTNADGCIPVTAALQEYLYNFSVSNQYFWDGNGWAETNGGQQSDEESQWLFACGYYR